MCRSLKRAEFSASVQVHNNGDQNEIVKVNERERQRVMEWVGRRDGCDGDHHHADDGDGDDDDDNGDDDDDDDDEAGL